VFARGGGGGTYREKKKEIIQSKKYFIKMAWKSLRNSAC
jgi:hypothetical protein